MIHSFTLSNRAKTFALLSAMALLPSAVFAQGYSFNDEVRLPATPVKNQAMTGTCWCFATVSFMESELLRMNRGTYDLSEMFIVRQKYLNQLEDNYLRQGKGNIGEGSLSHTFKHVYAQIGIVPQEAYPGINYASDHHDHRELSAYLGAVAGAAVDLKQRSPQYEKITHDILDTYLGAVPEKFSYQGKEYTPKSFAASLKLNMDDYVEITSFTHHPYYQAFDLEVPDNWEHERIYNVPLDELTELMDHALQTGYTVDWDGDVSERGFLFLKGVAINPEVKDLSAYAPADTARFAKMSEKERFDETYKCEKPYPEITVTPDIRQQGYEHFVTTDDHLMHIIGIAKDQNGTKYYITKNSWGPNRNDAKGYLNMSESFVRAKTIYVMVHKDALPKALRDKLNIH